MKRTFTCPSCSFRSVWNVRSMAEHGAEGLPMPFGMTHHFQPFEIFVCRGCGLTEWYANGATRLKDATSTDVRFLDDHRLRCNKCDGREHVLIAEFKERVRFHTDAYGHVDFVDMPLAVLRTAGDLCGTFALTSCRSCGFTNWYACNVDIDYACQAGGHLSSQEKCRRCTKTGLLRIDRVREAGGWELPVYLGWRSEAGTFRLRACVECGFTDWFAEGFDELVPDGKRVHLLQGIERTTTAQGGGPYR